MEWIGTAALHNISPHPSQGAVLTLGTKVFGNCAKSVDTKKPDTLTRAKNANMNQWSRRPWMYATYVYTTQRHAADTGSTVSSAFFPCLRNPALSWGTCGWCRAGCVNNLVDLHCSMQRGFARPSRSPHPTPSAAALQGARGTCGTAVGSQAPRRCRCRTRAGASLGCSGYMVQTIGRRWPRLSVAWHGLRPLG